MPATRATLLCHYRYDALDRLTGQGLTNAPPLQHFYCKSRLATEIQGALRQSIFQQGDWLLAQQTQQGIEHDTALLATDQQRSVLNTLKANHQAQPIAYAPYGHRRFISGWLSLMGFNGERPDPLTGHYLLGNGYRAFNPVLMRFNSPDSLSPFGKGGLNSYAFCSGDPVNNIDPSGRLKTKISINTTPKKAKFIYKGQPLKLKKNITTSQAELAHLKFNKISDQMNSLYDNILENDFKQRKSYQMIDTNPISLEMIARKKLASSGVTLTSVPADEFPPSLHYPDQKKLKAQIDLLDYLYESPPQIYEPWEHRLFTARYLSATHTKNGEVIAISSELAAKYNVRLLSLYKHQKKILSQERRGIFIRHFQ
ncbi:RHS repeat-associated core domain-containing protein [Pseudomonas moorei]|uniref:RHS repeat-associated core domain-containing protein n=1 Tax=Pseudomonas moorei TaxID=395599 RepID=UPI00200CFE1D|nr:RHS repeat-associated core domain-containing protein [Pseudomonas moorei]